MWVLYLDQLSDCANDQQHTFQNASQLGEIDLIDYIDISTDHNNQGDLSLVGSYFQKKSSSLEKLNFTSSAKRPLVKFADNSKGNCATNEDFCVNLDKQSFTSDKLSGNQTTPPENVTCDQLVQQTACKECKCVHLNIARYSKLDFDFLKFRNLNQFGVILHLKFIIDKKLKSFLFEGHK